MSRTPGQVPAARQVTAAWLAAALPGLVLMRQSFTGYVGLAWLAFCLWHWRELRASPAAGPMLRSPLAIGFAGSVGVLVVLVAIHGGELAALHNPSRFVLVLPMAIAVAAWQPSCRPYFAATIAAALLAGAVALWQVVITAEVTPLDAHLGFSNRNKFAYVAMSLLLVLLAGLRLPDAVRPPRGALLAGVAAAALALLLANTRGAWLAAVVPLWLWLASSRALASKHRLLAGMLIVALVAGLAAAPGSPVRDRLELGLAQYEQYEPGNVTAGDSIGERLEMWRASLVMAAAHPLIGVGPGRFNQALRALVAQGEAAPAIAGQGHPHNEYLAALATGGVVGLLALLAVLLGPLVHFVSLARRAGPGRSVTGACALAGALVCGATVIFCFTDPLFYIHFSTLYYALSLALLAGFAQHASRPATTP